jgi:hypothetical protein
MSSYKQALLKQYEREQVQKQRSLVQQLANAEVTKPRAPQGFEFVLEQQ